MVTFIKKFVLFPKIEHLIGKTHNFFLRKDSFWFQLVLFSSNLFECVLFTFFCHFLRFKFAFSCFFPLPRGFHFLSSKNPVRNYLNRINLFVISTSKQIQIYSNFKTVIKKKKKRCQAQQTDIWTHKHHSDS